MVARMEDIAKDLKIMNANHAKCRSEMLTKTEKNKDELSSIKLKAVGLASIIGGFTGFLGGLLKGGGLP